VSTLEYRLSTWIGAWLAELLCDYGESIGRIVVWMFVLIAIAGPAAFPVLGGLAWTPANWQAYSGLPTASAKAWYAYRQYLLYGLDVFTTASFSGLAPRTDAARVVSGFMAIIGIFLVGLLGFVAGNRIRHS
jgi:hypothetical protein